MSPASDAVTAMEPPPRSIMSGASVCTPSTTPSRLAPTIARYRATGVSRNGSPSPDAPAVDARIPALRCARATSSPATSSARARHASAFETSTWTNRPPISSATLRPPWSSMSTTTTDEPSRASRRALAAPTPDAAPVTTATGLIAVPSSGRPSSGRAVPREVRAVVGEHELAGDAAPEVGRERDDQTREVVGLAHPAKRQRLGQGVDVLVGQRRRDRRRERRARCDGVDADAVPAELDRERRGQVVDRGLRGAVRGQPARGAGRFARAHVEDDAAVGAFDHGLRLGAAARRREDEVLLDDVAHVVVVLVDEVGGAAPREAADVVHGDVE